MRDNRTWFWLFILLVAPIVLWVLPANFFDDTGVVLCPSQLLLGVKCGGCGMTRAVMHLHHFQLKSAIAFNPIVVIIYPALVVGWGICVWRAATRLRLFGYYS